MREKSCMQTMLAFGCVSNACSASPHRMRWWRGSTSQTSEPSSSRRAAGQVRCSDLMASQLERSSGAARMSPALCMLAALHVQLIDMVASS